MIIADKLKVTNRAEYLLYLWQVEDLIRVYQCDADRIQNEYLSKFNIPETQRAATYQWYADLCEMMRSEGKKEHGHLQIFTNILSELIELHAQLVNSPNFPYYREMYYKVLPYIVELRSKQKQDTNHPEEPELQTCFDLLYGIMLLRLQHKPIETSTEKAVKDIATLLGQLSDYYFKNQREVLEF